NRAVVNRSLATADVGRPIVALGSVALPRNPPRLQQTRRAPELRVSDENLLIGGAFYLESARCVADGREFDDIVAFTARERDGVAPALVGACAAIDVPGERGGGDFRVFERLAFRTHDLATNDIELLR